MRRGQLAGETGWAAEWYCHKSNEIKKSICNEVLIKG